MFKKKTAVTVLAVIGGIWVALFAFGLVVAAVAFGKSKVGDKAVTAADVAKG